MDKKFFSPEPRVIAHRGASGGYPENTKLAFTKAVEIGSDIIETDMHFTKDNNFVIAHDEVLERISNGTGRIVDHTVAELKRFDVAYNFTTDGGSTYPYRGRGHTFMTLEEMLEEFPAQRFNIDLKAKNPAQVSYYAEIIRKTDAFDRVLTASEYGPNVKEARKQLPGIATSISLWEGLWLYFLFKSGLLFVKNKFPYDALQIPEYLGTSHVVTETFVNAMHEKGLRVHVWTVNEEKDMRRLFDVGVDAIVSDEPLLLKKIVAEYFKD